MVRGFKCRRLTKPRTLHAAKPIPYYLQGPLSCLLSTRRHGAAALCRTAGLAAGGPDPPTLYTQLEGRHPRKPPGEAVAHTGRPLGTCCNPPCHGAIGKGLGRVGNQDARRGRSRSGWSAARRHWAPPAYGKQLRTLAQPAVARPGPAPQGHRWPRRWRSSSQSLRPLRWMAIQSRSAELGRSVIVSGPSAAGPAE